MTRIKVLVILSNLRVSNGVSSFIMNYYNRIDPAKIQMDFALLYDVPNPYENIISKNGGKVFKLPPLKNIKEHVALCRKIIKEENYDIIHNNTLALSLPLFYISKKAGVKARILHSHNSKLGETPYKNIRNQMVMPFLKACATNYAACSAVAANAMFGNNNYKFLPNVVSANDYIFSSERRNCIRSQYVKEPKKIVITVGRTAEQKNPFFAIDTIKKLHEIDETVEYWWVGSGPLDREITDYINNNELSGFIKLFGSREDIIDLYSAADLFFLPSLFEGLPVTCVEAQAMGLPIVLSDSITQELVYTDLVHYVSLNADKSEWVNTIIDALNSNPQRSNYNLNLLNSIFSDEMCGELLYNWYKSIL